MSLNNNAVDVNNSLEISSQPVKQHIISAKFSTPKIILITTIALVALAAIAVGVTCLAAPFALPAIAGGLLIGGGGILLTGVTLYGLYSLLFKKSSQPSDPFEPNDTVELSDPIETKDPIQSNEEPPEPLRPLSKISLVYAMQLFKNFDNSFPVDEGALSLPEFLKQCQDSFPEESFAKTRLGELIEVQTLIESKDDKIDQLTALYEKRMAAGEIFYFFTIQLSAMGSEYVLCKLKKEYGISSEAFKNFIQIYGSFLHEGTDIPLDQIPEEALYKGTDFAHLFHRCLGDDEVTPLFKKIYKINLLKKVLNDYPEWVEKEDFRAWVRSALIHLQKDLPSLQVNAALRKEWEKALFSLNTIQNMVFTLPKVISTIPAYDQLCAPLQLPDVKRTQKIEYPGVTEIKFESLPEKKELCLPPSEYLTLEKQEGLKVLNQWHDYLFSLYKNEGAPIENIESHALEFLLNLPKTFNASCFSDEDKLDIVSKIYDCANLALTLHITMGRVGLHPSRFLAFLKCFHLLVDVVQTIENSYFSKYTIDPESFYYSLLDDYYDLGPYQKEIYQLLEEIQRKGKEVNLTKLGTNASEYIKGFYLKNSQRAQYLTKDEEQNFKSDFEGKFLPKPVCILKSLHLVVDAFIAPHKYLEYRKTIYKSRIEFKDYIDGLRRALVTSSAKILSDKLLLSVDRTFTLNPIGLKFNPDQLDYSDQRVLFEEIGLPLSPYYYSFGGIREVEIRNRLAEGTLSNVTLSDTSQDGHFGADVKDVKYQGMSTSGLKQTQFNVYKEKFLFPNTSIEVSRDLQKMASGSDNRASNALYTFNKYPFLLSLKEHGEDYKRVFRLLLFKRDLLIQELELNCEMASVTLSKFDELLVTFEKTGDYETWLFIYLAHVDALSSLQNTTLDCSERERMHKVHSKKLLKWIEEVETNPLSDMKQHRNSLHLAYLQTVAILKEDNEDTLFTAKSLILAQTLIANMLNKDMFKGQILFDFMLQTLPRIAKAVEKDPTLLDEILAYKFKKEVKPREWTSISKGVYQYHSILIDFNHFRFSKGGKLEGVLPREIQEDESFIHLFGNEILKAIYEFTYVPTPLGKAWHVSILSNEREYSLYLCQGNANFPLLFRKEETQGWTQWLRIQHAPKEMPIDLRKGYLWSGKESVVEDPHHNRLYALQFEGDNLTSLKRFTLGNSEVVLNAHHMTIFSQIDDKEGYIVFLKDNIPTITYLKGSAEYFWNSETKKWESALYKGYSLTEKAIEEWVLKGTKEADATLFVSHFKNYHFLENSEGKAKLILPFVSFKRKVESEVKYTLTLCPQFDLISPWKKQNFMTFDLEYKGHLKSKRPQDFLYLAYVFYVQGKYGEALVYLQRSQAVWSLNDSDDKAIRELIKEWIFEWKDETPNGIAFKTKLLHQEHQLLTATYPSTAKLQSYDATLLPPLLQSVEIYLKNESKIDPLLRLSEFEKAELTFLAPRATAWIRNKIAKNGSSSFITGDIRKIYASNKTDKELLYWSLNQEINFLEEQVARNFKKSENVSFEIKDYIPIPLIDVSTWLVSMKENEMYLGIQEKVQKIVSELREIYVGDTLSDEIGCELALDLEKYTKKMESSFSLNPKADLTQLEEDLNQLERRLLKEEKFLWKSILGQFIPIHLTAAELGVRKLKQQEANFNFTFEKLRYSYGINDFSDLMESKSLSEQQIPFLKQAVHQYEVVRTDRKLISRKIALLDKLKKDPGNTQLQEDFANLLQEWRRYDVETHPCAHILLLLEDELNITARSTQIHHIDKLITHPNSYMHEAMAAGKTTLLRNIFSAIESQKGHLAGVMTYAPLMAMHHREYAGVNLQALGSVAYPFYYNRNADHDISALQTMIIYHYKALIRNGRIDQTPQASISLNHTLSEMLISLKKSDSMTIAKLKPSILALQKLLTLRGEKLSFYSDEIDKIFDPTKDYNYSVGNATILQEKFYAPALMIVKLLMEENSLREFLNVIQDNVKNSALLKLSNEKFEEYLRQLASLCYDHFKLPFDKAMTLDYLTEVHQKNREEQEKIVSFYKDSVLNCKDQEIRFLTQTLHSYIGVLLRGMKDKLLGTHFGRSMDGISVKPFSFSAVCQESSQRSIVLSTILEICIDYLVSGVGVTGVKAYIEKIKAYASKELEQVSCLDETKAARQFQNRFSILLSQVKDADLQSISNKISNTYPLLEECLIEILLKDFTYYEEKIEGNAHQLPYLGKKFAGSSGSPERIKTLPSSIHKHPELIRQEGAIGSVFYAFFKDFNENEDLIELDSSLPVEEQIAKLLQPGDVLIDNAPFFSGKKGLEIVESLARHSAVSAPYRYLDEEHDVAILHQGKTSKGDEGIDLNEVISVISHKGRQGTNWVFAKGKKGLVEMGPGTELTSFYQSIMRLRMLGKGQKAKILFDDGFKQKWESNPILKDRSLLAKLICSLIDNEASFLKNLHFQANRKQIRSIRKKAVDQIKRSIPNVEALLSIKEISEYKLIESVPLDPEKFGYPILLEKPDTVLKTLVNTESSDLAKLKTKIGKLEIDKSFINQCSKIIDEHLDSLKNPDLVMEPRDLPDNIAGNQELLSDAIEEIEIIAANEVEVLEQQEQEQYVSLEVENELSLETEKETEYQKTKSTKHPTTEEGREWTERSLSWYWWEKENNFIDPTCFPNIFISNYALGILDDDRDATDPEMKKIRNDRLWISRLTKSKLPISSKVMISISPSGELRCHMGSVKDTDFGFFTPLNEKEVARNWKPLSFEEAKAEKNLIPEQKSVVESSLDPRYGKDYYDGKNKYYTEFKEWQFFKIDLYETKIPTTLNPSLHKKWIETITLAKFLCAEANFSEAEKLFLDKWLDTHYKNLPKLEWALHDYLYLFNSSLRQNELAQFIRNKIPYHIIDKSLR